jgi:hypothetical protein
MRYAYRKNSKARRTPGREAEYHLGHLPPSQQGCASGAAMQAGISRVSHWLAGWPDIRADTPATACTPDVAWRCCTGACLDGMACSWWPRMQSRAGLSVSR